MFERVLSLLPMGVLVGRAGLGRPGEGRMELSMSVFTRELVLI